jgi:hypothetical protein
VVDEEESCRHLDVELALVRGELRVLAVGNIFWYSIDSASNFLTTHRSALLQPQQQQQPAVATMKTQWKDIPAVPTSQEFLDIVLSRT